MAASEPRPRRRAWEEEVKCWRRTCGASPFSGNDWSGWAFSFKRGIRAQNHEVFKAMQNMENLEDTVSEECDVPVEQEARSGELYDLLCQFCTGEALGIVRSAADMQGFAAWQKLRRKYNPKTMARGV